MLHKEHPDIPQTGTGGTEGMKNFAMRSHLAFILALKVGFEPLQRGFVFMAFCMLAATTALADPSSLSNANNYQKLDLEKSTKVLTDLAPDIEGHIYNSDDLVKRALEKLSPNEIFAAARNGNPQAALLAGWIHDHGEAGYTSDEERALPFYLASCDGQLMRGCRNVAIVKEENSQDYSDNIEAIDFYQRGCDGGDLMSCRLLGTLFLRLTSEDMSETRSYDHRARALFEAACNVNEYGSCGHIGWMYEMGRSFEPDSQKAILFYRLACDNLHFCSYLGNMYMQGTGVEKDEAQAISLFEKACEEQDPQDCMPLASAYYHGEGVEQNLKRAADLFETACELDWLYACGALGYLYESGEGVKQDERRALKLYKRICDDGLMSGCDSLGLMFIHGKGVKQDYETAADLFMQACGENLANSCGNLGIMFYNGQGVTQDVGQGLDLMQRACEGGELYYCDMLQEEQQILDEI